MQVLITIALIVIGVLLFEFIIFAHEFGHFITAKRSGVQVNEFALGMGPKLFSFKKGETTYSLRLFPIGGYCAMEGEDEESKNPRAFTNAKVWKRMIIIVAGAVMNIIAGFILVFVLTINQAEFYSTTVKGFTPVSFTEMSGLQKGDKIVNVGGYSVGNSKDLLMGIQLLPCETVDSDSLGVYKEQACLSAKTCLEKLYSDEKMDYDTAMDIYTDTFSEQTRKLYAAGDEKTAEEIYRETVDKIYSEAKVDKPKDFEYPEVEISEKTERFVGDVEVVRDGRNVTLRNVHFYTAVNQKGKTVVQLDFAVDGKDKNFGTVMEETFTGTVSNAKIVWKSLELLVKGKFSLTDMSGPVGITAVVSDAASVGLQSSFGDAVLNIVMIMALITINLGIFNMLPFPALDGGRFVFLLIEAIIRRPIPRKVEYIVNGAGLSLLILLIIFISGNDIYKLFTGTFPTSDS